MTADRCTDTAPHGERPLSKRDCPRYATDPDRCGFVRGWIGAEPGPWGCDADNRVGECPLTTTPGGCDVGQVGHGNADP